jgi:hypothetical protein
LGGGVEELFGGVAGGEVKFLVVSCWFLVSGKKSQPPVAGEGLLGEK